MDEKKNIGKLFGRNLSATFVSAMMPITLAGMLFVDSEAVHEGLFQLSGGITFEGIVQIFIWSCIISGLMVALTSDIWFGKIMLLWRVAVLMLSAIVVSAGFAVAFRWFPLNVWEAWATFLVFFIAGFGGGLATLVAKTKIEDKRYNRLLSEYKFKRGDERND
ncbi:MAG: hypothetical protein FWC70_12010 [Defluviitaleaceae bacterium]|nr:hypothetical protein [Defluviitaleaceae bacterium]